MTSAPAPEPGRNRDDHRLRDDYSVGARCQRCFFSPGLCVCGELPQFDVPLHVAVIRHRTEMALVSNTGRFVPELLRDASLHELGLRDRPFDGSWLEDPDRDYYILFPEQTFRHHNVAKWRVYSGLQLERVFQISAVDLSTIDKDATYWLL